MSGIDVSIIPLFGLPLHLVLLAGQDELCLLLAKPCPHKVRVSSPVLCSRAALIRTVSNSYAPLVDTKS